MPKDNLTYFKYSLHLRETWFCERFDFELFRKKRRGRKLSLRSQMPTKVFEKVELNYKKSPMSPFDRLRATLGIFLQIALLIFGPSFLS